MQREPVWRFAVLGCGSIGKRHITNLLALGERQVVGFDPRPDRREEAAKLGASTCDSLEAVWSQRPDATLITVPNSLHIPLALQAARHGCHLFIEKPLSHTEDGIGELLREVKARRLVTLVGCNLRFHPGLRAVKQEIDAGSVGRVVSVRAEFGQYLPDWHPWEDYRLGYSARSELGGGIILDSIHELDYLRWMLGEVAAVACFAGRLGELEITTEDTAAILLRFAGGALGEVHLDYLQRAPRRTCHVIGTEGTLDWDFASGEVRCFTAASQQWRNFPLPSGWNTNQMYVDEMRHFLACLTGRETAQQDIAQAAEALAIALAARRAAESGTVISLSAARAKGS